MEYRVLKYFLTVVNAGSISKAAELLHITQPTLSRQLKQLEEDIGAKLMIFSKRSIILTPEGKLLEKRAREILELSDRTEKELRNRRTARFGVINLFSLGLLAPSFSACLIKKFKMEYPDAEFYLYSSCADTMREYLDTGLSSVALTVGAVQSDKYDKINLNHKWEWSVLVPLSDSISQQEYISTEELEKLSVIAPSQILIPQTADKMMALLYEKSDIFSGTYNLYANATALVKEGVGYAIGLFSDKQWVDKDVKAIPIKPLIPLETYLIWPKTRELNTATKLFIEFVSDITAM